MGVWWGGGGAHKGGPHKQFDCCITLDQNLYDGVVVAAMIYCSSHFHILLEAC
jgi:hypothetical protein